jgi:hypothetical protein
MIIELIGKAEKSVKEEFLESYKSCLREKVKRKLDAANTETQNSNYREALKIYKEAIDYNDLV